MYEYVQNDFENEVNVLIISFIYELHPIQVWKWGRENIQVCMFPEL